ncbi:MAG TPA: glycine/sarcosine/betaine reductase selenoprotein B family protein [Methylomirabilota bacterium]|nr:glycine/sarcosine/betaine reductase selenoprotein B family protein [Methylomirabilota bacterium]
MTARAKADTRWIADFRSRYAAWWPGAAPLIEQHDYASAFTSYPWPAFTETPWTPLTKPLAALRIGVVTTGGLYRTGHDLPFDGKAPDGDWSLRAIPAGTAIQTLAISHEHFPHETARADMNTIFPLDRLRELEACGEIGGLTPTHYSLMGYCTRAADIAETMAPEIASRLKAEGADAAFLVPV